jgi:hypothetical protein
MSSLMARCCGVRRGLLCGVRGVGTVSGLQCKAVRHDLLPGRHGRGQGVWCGLPPPCLSQYRLCSSTPAVLCLWRDPPDDGCCVSRAASETHLTHPRAAALRRCVSGGADEDCGYRWGRRAHAAALGHRVPKECLSPGHSAPVAPRLCIVRSSTCAARSHLNACIRVLSMGSPGPPVLDRLPRSAGVKRS